MASVAEVKIQARAVSVTCFEKISAMERGEARSCQPWALTSSQRIHSVSVRRLAGRGRAQSLAPAAQATDRVLRATCALRKLVAAFGLMFELARERRHRIAERIECVNESGTLRERGLQPFPRNVTDAQSEPAQSQRQRLSRLGQGRIVAGRAQAFRFRVARKLA